MVKVYILCLLVIAPQISLGKVISIDSKVYHSGKKIGSPRMRNTVGEKSKVVMKDFKNKRDYNLEVITKEMSGNDVILKYRLSIREANDELINRGSVKLSDNLNAKVLIDKGNVELNFKLTKKDRTRLKL